LRKQPSAPQWLWSGALPGCIGRKGEDVTGRELMTVGFGVPSVAVLAVVPCRSTASKVLMANIVSVRSALRWRTDVSTRSPLRSRFAMAISSASINWVTHSASIRVPGSGVSVINAPRARREIRSISTVQSSSRSASGATDDNFCERVHFSFLVLV
jgi:hypothetical protein